MLLAAVLPVVRSATSFASRILEAAQCSCGCLRQPPGTRKVPWFTGGVFHRKVARGSEPCGLHRSLLAHADASWVGVRGRHSACATGRFACEAFAQEPIHHQLGLNLKLGWCGLHDCAEPPSLLARNPAENFGRDWWVVDVAVDQGAIRHDLFPKQSGL